LDYALTREQILRCISDACDRGAQLQLMISSIDALDDNDLKVS